MVLNSQRTIYGLNLQMNMLLNMPYVDLPNTTLNEKFNILVSQPIPDDTFPRLKYIAIGKGGSDIIDDSEYKFSKHSAADAALFEHIPFIVRPVTMDLLPQERSNYRFRVVQNIDGVDYACYYLKIITKVLNKPGLYKVTTSSIEDSKLEYMLTNTSQFLNPTPRIVSEDYLDPIKTEYYAKTTKIGFMLYDSEIEEIDTALTILYGEHDFNLTEIALCSGIDNDLESGIEASNVTVNFFVNIDINIKSNLAASNDIIKSIEIGGLEPFVV